MEAFGLHSAFYYCGVAHLLVNLCACMHDAIRKNALVLLSVQPEVRSSILDGLDAQGIPTNDIHFCDAGILVSAHKRRGVEGLKKRVNTLTRIAVNGGFSGIYWIEQASYVVQRTSKKDFLSFENDLTNALLGTKCSVLCVYNFENVFDKSACGDVEAIRHCLECHSHILTGFRLQEMSHEYEEVSTGPVFPFLK